MARSKTTPEASARAEEGNLVTGNGTSAVDWCRGYAYYPYFIIDP